MQNLQPKPKRSLHGRVSTFVNENFDFCLFSLLLAGWWAEVLFLAV